MLKRMIRVVAVMMLVGSIGALGGCNRTEEVPKEVEKQMPKEGEMILAALEEKYGETFEMTGIGGRWGSMNSNTVKARCNPTKDKSMMFNVEMNRHTHIVYDKYLNVVVGRNEQETIQKIVDEIWDECRVDIYNDTGIEYPEENNLDMRYEEFLRLYPGNWQLIDIFINSPETINEQEEVKRYKKFFERLKEEKYFKSTVTILYLKEEGYKRYDELINQEYSVESYYSDKEPHNLYCLCGFRVRKEEEAIFNESDLAINFDAWGKWGEWR